MGSPITEMIPVEAEALVAIAKREALKIADRCDRCGSQAFVAAHHVAHTTLLFCGHHFSKHEPALMAAGLEFQDERHRINEKPSVSASEISAPDDGHGPL